jgi:hypothetical protein
MLASLGLLLLPSRAGAAVTWIFSQKQIDQMMHFKFKSRGSYG